MPDAEDQTILIELEGGSEELTPNQTLPTEQEEGSEELDPEHPMDKQLEKIGYGFFHVLLVLIAGWALASDSVEVLSVSFVIPVIDKSSSNVSFHPTTV